MVLFRDIHHACARSDTHTHCSQVGLETMFEQLHTKLEDGGEGGANRFHSLSQGLREEIERLGRTQHQWEGYNVDQLVRLWKGVTVFLEIIIIIDKLTSPSLPPQKYVQMSALDDKDVQTAEQWEAAVQFMSSSLKKQIRVAEEEMQRMEGPTSYYDRWIRWKGQNELEIKRQAVANELNNFLRAEPVRVCVFAEDFIQLSHSTLSDYSHDYTIS